MTPEELARACAEVMWAGDAASQALGIRVDSVGTGRAVLSMTVREDMVNGWRIAHGGLVAALADSAFAFACNGYDRVTVAAGFEVRFRAPSHLGDRLVATAVERSREGRRGVYDVTVHRLPDRVVIAEFVGRSHSTDEPILAGDRPG